MKKSRMDKFLPEVRKSHDGNKVVLSRNKKRNIQIHEKSGGDIPLRLSITKLQASRKIDKKV